MQISDYITLGYRCYSLKDLLVGELAEKLPTIAKLNRWDYFIEKNIIYIKNTNEYDKYRNPYL